MKASRSYSFRLVAESATATCTSPELSFTTGALPDWMPVITLGESQAGASKGFIVTTPGLPLGSSQSRGLPSAYILDTDGDIVWWTPDLLVEPSRAQLSWDGESMWIMNANNAAAGKVVNISMDGLTTMEFPQLDGADHDLTVLPGGGVATIINSDSFVEMAADGTVTTIIADLSSLYDGSTGLHPNAVHYYPDDDSFTLSDRIGSLFVKFTRSGELTWQLGGDNPLGQAFQLVGLDPWLVNHGHHMTADGHFLFFNNNCEGTDACSDARLLEVSLDTDSWTATKTWEYVDSSSLFFGDAERLPNGNVLATYSTSGLIKEVTPQGEVVQSFDNSYSFEHDSFGSYALFGYADFRTSLYGPPPR
jgi:hypothetical protein